jgi:hypothetical protein
MTNPNDSAFAAYTAHGSGQSGLTKREYFAAMAMQGIITADLESEKDASLPASSVVTAALSVKYADSLIAALNATK